MTTQNQLWRRTLEPPFRPELHRTDLGQGGTRPSRRSHRQRDAVQPQGANSSRIWRRISPRSLGVDHAYACTSGTAAIHIAVAAINPEPGDEIITTSITDMGALTPILYQGAIPVFADVDPLTCNVTAETIEPESARKPRPSSSTHLFGNPCKMDEIMELANSRGIPVIEDAAQAFGAEYRGRKIGTIGAIGCFSLQQGKHITTGEGGLVVSNDPALARRAFLHVHKAWGYGDQNPDHYFLALNYRMSELQGAVAAAQLPKLPGVVAARIETADRLTEMLTGVPGIQTPAVENGARHTYWKYCLRVDGDVIDRRIAGPRQGARGKGHLFGSTLHPETGLHVPGIQRPGHLRLRATTPSISPGLKRSTTIRPSSPAPIPASRASWSCRGTKNTQTNM